MVRIGLEGKRENSFVGVQGKSFGKDIARKVLEVVRIHRFNNKAGCGLMLPAVIG